MAKPIRYRAQAQQDFADIIAYYEIEAGVDTALIFTDELQRTYRSVADAPGIGSPRFGEIARIPGLRSRMVRRFPYLVFYIEQRDHVEMLRILHARRDIPACLADPSDDFSS